MGARCLGARFGARCIGARFAWVPVAVAWVPAAWVLVVAFFFRLLLEQKSKEEPLVFLCFSNVSLLFRYDLLFHYSGRTAKAMHGWRELEEVYEVLTGSGP